MARPGNNSGIDERHQRSCRTIDGGRCNCRPSYQVNVWDNRTGKRIRKTFKTLTEAKAWRQDAAVALRKGLLRASDGRTVKQVSDDWLAEVRKGAIRNRSGDVYKPSAIRAYERMLRLHVYPTLGARKFSQLQRADVQTLADELHAQGLNASTVLGSIRPLKAIYRRALARGHVSVNPTTGLEVAARRSERARIVSPDGAVALLGALSDDDRPLWATGFYAGLRSGELRALRWDDVALLDRVIHVTRNWDDVEGEIKPKSPAAVRRVPIVAVLVDYLEVLFARSDGEGFVFGKDGRPFDPRRVGERAKKAWEDSELDGLKLHEARHTFASFMIAAGCNAKSLSTYMGHSSISITFDIYGHLMPGNEAQSAGLLDAYLASPAG